MAGLSSGRLFLLCLLSHNNFQVCTPCLYRLLCCATLLQALPAAPRFCRLFLLRHALAGSSCCATLWQALPAAPCFCRLFLLRHALEGFSCCATLLQALPAAPRLCRLFLLRHAFAGSSCCATLVQALPAAVTRLLARAQAESKLLACMLRFAITEPLALSLLRCSITKSLALSPAAVVGLLARAQYIVNIICHIAAAYVCNRIALPRDVVNCVSS